jgi:hypothetical protein
MISVISGTSERAEFYVLKIHPSNCINLSRQSESNILQGAVHAVVSAFSYQRWQISRSDGKSNLIGSLRKREAHILPGTLVEKDEFIATASSCPVKIIKIME